MDSIKLKDLKKGEFFTLKPIEEPSMSQVFIKNGYDRSDKKYWCNKCSDVCDGKYLPGNKIVYIGFTF